MIAHTAYIILLGNCTRWPIPVVVGIKYYVVRRFRAQFWGQTNVDDSVFGRQKAFNMPLLHLSVNHPHLCEEYDLLIMSYVFEVTTAQGAVFSQLCVYYDNSTSSVCPTVRPQTQHHQLGLKLFPSSSFLNRLLQPPLLRSVHKQPACSQNNTCTQANDR